MKSVLSFIRYCYYAIIDGSSTLPVGSTWVSMFEVEGMKNPFKTVDYVTVLEVKSGYVRYAHPGPYACDKYDTVRCFLSFWRPYNKGK